MTDELFEQLLQKRMFGTASADERRDLAAAALESPQRRAELAQAEEVLDHFADPDFRQELIDALPKFVAPQKARVAWWQALFRPAILVPIAGGAASVIALLVVRDTVWRDRPSDQPVSTTATAAPPDTDRPAGISASDRAMAAAFTASANRRADFMMTLTKLTPYRPGESVEVRVALPASGTVHAVVRGPEGHLREVFPSSGADARVARGEHTFTFPATGRMDPATGGRSTVRVFFVAGGSPPADDIWAWLTTNATFQEASYDVGF
jgi:hypothetical protein